MLLDQLLQVIATALLQRFEIKLSKQLVIAKPPPPPYPSPEVERALAT